MTKYKNLVDRFIRYVKVDTRSNEFSETIPSDQKEVDFLKNLKNELEQIGLKNVRTLKDGYVFAELPASKGLEDKSAIGFISHVDTADFESKNINPKFVENYDGKSVIKLNDDFSLEPSVFPNLKNYKNQTLITTDGTTLLGADDKAGVTEIITAMEYLIANPEIKHGKVVIAFGPDEEIGIGADNFDVKEFGAEFAYTVDGGPLGELEQETFNGAGVTINVEGKAVHPGTAKGKLINPFIVINEIFSLIPVDERPENTSDRQGYYYVTDSKTNPENGQIRLIIRDHDRKIFEERKQRILDIVEIISKKYPGIITAEIKDQYYNMGEIIKDKPESVELAKKAMESLGIKPLIEPVRGGTDGSKITFLGIPTPNLFAGGENMHGRYEYVSTTTMEKATDVILKIIELH